MKAIVPLNFPALCPLCLGRGCRCCQGGLICPACRGRRVNDDGRVCPTCCEGNQINPRKERRAILALLAAQKRQAQTARRRTA